MKVRASTIIAVFIIVFLAACGGRQDWPSLADPSPDPATRSVDNIRMSPVQPPKGMTADQDFDSAEEALDALEARRRAVDIARATFGDLRGTCAVTADGDRSNWGSCQIALTRLSTALSALEALLDVDVLPADTRAAARAYFTRWDAYAAGERRRLASK